MSESNLPQPYKLLLSGVAAIALLTAGLIFGVSQKTGRNVLKPRQFGCTRMPEAQSGELLWTVMVKRGDAPKPFLRIISGMEGDVTPDQRCKEVAATLDRHYGNQLKSLFYRPNPATPNRHSVCIQTIQHQGEDCANLIILKSNIDPQRFFERFTVDLQTFNSQTESNQRTESSGAIATFSTSTDQPQTGKSRIDLQQWFAKE